MEESELSGLEANSGEPDCEGRQGEVTNPALP
jgi:hypothetical protein